MLALIDGDILVYRIGFSTENETEDIVKARISGFIDDLLLFKLPQTTTYQGYITLDSASNFRVKLATFAPYKGNRPGKKPKHYDFIRQELQDHWKFIGVVGEEADDAIARHATKELDKSIICSIDKDFDQVPGFHYNFVKQQEYYVTPDQGFYNFCVQTLVGDRIDNIVGIRGIGPAKARKRLETTISNESRIAECAKLYRQAGDGDLQRFKENCRLLWLRRQPDGRELIEDYLDEL